MASVKVKFRPSAAVNREGTVYYQVIHERKPRQIATDYHIFSYEWNEHKSTVTCCNSSDRLGYILAVRERIKGDLARLSRIIQNLENRRFEYEADEIVKEYERIQEENSLFNYMERLIAKLKYLGKVRTSETYRSTLNSFRKFRDGNDIMIESLSREVMEEYQSWMEQSDLAPNTVSFYIRVLKAVYNRAVDDELTDDHSPFRKVYTGVEKTVKRALPMKTIKKIKSLDLSLNPKLDYARDMFILSFMLRGMSFVDMAFLKKSDLKNGHITYRRRKTGQQLKIKWTPEMQSIVEKYPSKSTEYLLPILINSEAVALYAYRNVGYRVNRYLKRIGESLGLPIPLTMYVARHSWASAAKSKGIPVSIISESMGHDSELTTQIYLASLDTSAVDKANSIILKELN
ncbi:MAG: site-specific integrase [Muribaculaceae bacterium]|nr:site-specific integrase [Muribaculaceae bacterium]